MEYFLRVSYKLQNQKWQTRSMEDKELIETRKRAIQQSFKQ